MKAKAMRSSSVIRMTVGNQMLANTHCDSWIGITRLSGSHERWPSPMTTRRLTAGRREAGLSPLVASKLGGGGEIVQRQNGADGAEPMVEGLEIAQLRDQQESDRTQQRPQQTCAAASELPRRLPFKSVAEDKRRRADGGSPASGMDEAAAPA